MYNRQDILSYFAPEMISPSLDLTHTPLYDSFTIAAGSALTEATSALFTTPLGSGGKTLAQTNLKFANRLQTGEIFAIMVFQLRIAENILFVDLLTILNGFVFRFYLGTDKPFQVIPIWAAPAGGGISGYAATTVAATTLNATTNGLPTNQATRLLATPIPIDSNMNFSANLGGTASYTLTAGGGGGTGFTFMALLDGIHGRLVM